MNRKTLFMVVGLMVIALAVVGVGYGLWFEDLKIHGEVTTGELDVELTGPYVERYFANEQGEVICDDIVNNDVEDCPEAKFASVTCTTEVVHSTDPPLDENPPSDGTDLDRINITVTGAYPSFHCDVTFDIDNVGNVPVHLALYTDPASNWDPGLTCGPTQADPTGYTVNEAGILVDALGEPVQLHSEGMIYCNALVHFTNDDGLDEGAGPFIFQYHFRAYQWNEGPEAGGNIFFPVVESQ